MNDVHKATVEIRRPRGSFPGEIAEGWYVVRDNAVIMTDAGGKPISEAKHHFNPGEDARLVACGLIRGRRRNHTSVTGFHHKIAYPRPRYL